MRSRAGPPRCAVCQLRRTAGVLQLGRAGALHPPLPYRFFPARPPPLPQLIGHLRKQMPAMFGGEKKQKKMMEDIIANFEAVRAALRGRHVLLASGGRRCQRWATRLSPTHPHLPACVARRDLSKSAPEGVSAVAARGWAPTFEKDLLEF
jgi:hypothetical protein